LERQNEIKAGQFESVVGYITNNTQCKSRLLLAYFDEKKTADCGICSVCIAKNKKEKSPVDLANAILGILKDAPSNSRELEQRLDLTPQETVFALQILLENG